MNPNCYTNPGKGDIGKYICLTHVTLSSCKTGTPPPPPTHTHTHIMHQHRPAFTQTQHIYCRNYYFSKACLNPKLAG